MIQSQGDWLVLKRPTVAGFNAPGDSGPVVRVSGPPVHAPLPPVRVPRPPVGPYGPEGGVVYAESPRRHQRRQARVDAHDAGLGGRVDHDLVDVCPEHAPDVLVPPAGHRIR